MTQESISICKKLGLKLELIWAPNTMTHIQTNNNDGDQLQKYMDEIQSLEREAGVPIHPGVVEREISGKLFMQGKLTEALEHAEKALALYEKQNDKYNLTFFMSEVAHALRQSGELEKAQIYYRKAIPLWQGFGHRAAVAHQLECFGFIALAREQNERAIKLISVAESLRNTSNSVRTPAEQKEFEEAKAKLQSQMEEDKFDKAWNEGASINMEQAIDFAVTPTSHP